jgi:hypothetical protein
MSGVLARPERDHRLDAATFLLAQPADVAVGGAGSANTRRTNSPRPGMFGQ